MQFISLAIVKNTLDTLPKKARVGKTQKGRLTLADLGTLSDRERRNLANLVSRQLPEGK